MPKKVLIITYYWPPAGGIAVQRWVKFCKYLTEYGWQPIVYTVSNGHYQLTDDSMMKDVSEDLTVIKQPIWEPYKLYQLFSRKKKSDLNPDEIKPGEGASLMGRISNWVRSNFFIPDARKFWIKPSIKFLDEYLMKNKVDAIVSTGPPHSAHLIALGLKKKNKLPWLADFRDPWTTMDYYRELLLTQWADRKHHRLEKEVLISADTITVVGQGMKTEFEMKRGREVNVITNGFDESDFLKEKTELDKDFSILHIGSFFARINPTGLWKALEELKNENHPVIDKLKLKLTGRVAPSVIESIKTHNLEQFLTVVPFQPHDEAIRQMKSAAILLLCVYEENKFIVTGKLFEYLAAHRPILFTGSKDGDAARIVLETEVGPVFSRDEVETIKQYIQLLYQQFENGELQLKSNQSQKYSHRLLAKQVADQLNRIVKT
ncbi:MAG: glycosyl transferase family 1 [Bacteroidetes bacterium]|nr:glycosyl transferase family 1 [Bacteroidota bacterium]MBI3481935.1 glycosyl transferase family 1 [Bacteroidota bacterium]